MVGFVFKHRFGYGVGGGGEPLLLDDYLTDNVGMWSLHKVTSDSVFSGAIARHRVDTGGQPEYDVNPDGDGLFVDTAQMLTDAGSNSSYWTKLYQQNGSGLYDEVQGTTSQQFRAINAGTLDTSDTSTPILQNPTGTAISMGSTGVLPEPRGAGTVMVVLSTINGTTKLPWSTNGAGEYGQIDASGGFTTGFTGKADSGTRAITSPPSIPIQQLMVVAWRFDATSHIFINGTKYNYSSQPGDFATPNRIDFGYASGTFTIDRVGEMLVWDAALSDDDIQTIQTDQESRWGIS